VLCTPTVISHQLQQQFNPLPTQHNAHASYSPVLPLASSPLPFHLPQAPKTPSNDSLPACSNVFGMALTADHETISG